MSPAGSFLASQSRSARHLRSLNAGVRMEAFKTQTGDADETIHTGEVIAVVNLSADPLGYYYP